MLVVNRKGFSQMWKRLAPVRVANVSKYLGVEVKPKHRTWTGYSYRSFRVCQRRGSIDEATAAYTASYVRIAD